MPEHPTKVALSDGTELDPSLVSLSLKDGQSWEGNGEKELTCSSSDLSVTDTTSNAKKTAKVDKVGAEATFTYGGEALKGEYSVNVAAGQSFDLAKLKVTGADGKEIAVSTESAKATAADGTGAKATATVAAKNPHGNGSAKALFEDKAADTYTVTLSVDASSTGYACGGTRTFTVHVVKDAVEDSEVTVYKSTDTSKVPVSSLTVPYGTEVNAGDYKVALAETVNTDGDNKAGEISLDLYDSEGKKVPSGKAEHAGTYTLRVSDDGYKYDFSAVAPVKVTVTPVDLTDIQPGMPNDALKDWYGEYYAVVPSQAVQKTNVTLKVNTGTDGKDDYSKYLTEVVKSGEATKSLQRWDAAKSEWVDVTEVKEAGSYRVGAVLAKDSAAGDITFADQEAHATWVSFTVVSKAPEFSDVAPSAWYFESVAKASGSIVHGYDGKVFRPEASITRAEVATVLYNAATDGKGTATGTDSGFSDVASDAWYAPYVAWAHKVGVVNGDGGEFRPNDEVTTEEFAAMLANYAKVIEGADVDGADASALDSANGGASVSDWARQSVAWAVETHVMGNGGAAIDAQAPIFRARVTAMVVNHLSE